MTSNVENRTSLPIVVVFGRPGSGKTTILEKALEMANQELGEFDCMGLDLDVCVPQWMKDNFSKGIYPTLQERIEFADSACAYVDSCLSKRTNNIDHNIDHNIGCEKPSTKLSTIISFSFVNNDLRDTFRKRFPHAVWLLIDTNEKEAMRRINAREGHFYKGKPKDGAGNPLSEELKTTDKDSLTNVADNSDWKFDSVDFPHFVLDGTAPVNENSQRVLEALCDAVTTIQC
mmetsp:Transcript_19699/g.29000  ORF Transcript_19699/g.29000 Transcript_19699/m.29000 type:complete len:231 (-) Transcript_19699:77-769(-)|eukprot:CAMPEP_0195520500 /NCGR_PEP_ID=MMETSP0794_2-20130614/17052_1 /TAXON_ID=515487 /ORGANISM="Stephanopyxis turris, Strain CCMP 815" /LENGTH=230 /DNA_ID=CAMNT_0040649875 /DNA_START=136 /DNA_END=828 /DNA_ORIENTATION=+